MKAIILAAGTGMRLGGGHLPKCLLQFGGKSLLERHLHILESAGIRRVVIGVGYMAEMIRAEIRRCECRMQIETVFNPDYRQGNIVTLWRLREELDSGENLLLMDADVLYDHRIMHRLVHSPIPDCFLMDRNFEQGDEPVKLCLRDRRIVAFGKHVDPAPAWDTQGESVGFFKLSAGMASRLRTTAESFVAAGRLEAFYEEALRVLALEGEGKAFGVEDVTGLPWIEIDFPEDIEKANRDVLPALDALQAA
jgi:choline kinase